MTALGAFLIHRIDEGLGQDLHWDELAVSLAQARSMKDVQAAFAARAAETPSGNWILGGSGWHESQLAEGRLPVRQELDAVTPNNPVYLRRGGHVAVANSAALKIASVTPGHKNERRRNSLNEMRNGSRSAREMSPSLVLPGWIAIAGVPRPAGGARRGRAPER